jgi:hypothetical protein
MEVIQAQVEELRGQIETLRNGEDHRGQIKDVSPCSGDKGMVGGDLYMSS